MGGEFPAEPEIEIPDSIPEELSNAYGDEARRAIITSRIERSLRREYAVSRERSEFLGTAVFVFSCAVIAAVFFGALVYATLLWPTVGGAIDASVFVLLGGSILFARRVTRPRATPIRI